jgi:tetratricopeptide (TPR) repeat protein
VAGSAIAKVAVFLLLVLGFAGAESFAGMRTLLEEGRYELAAEYEGPRLVEAFPDMAEAHYLYGQALYLTGYFEEAMKRLERALELDPKEPRYRWLEALLLAEGGQAGRAQELLAELFEASPSYPLAMDWGRIAWQAGDFEAAIHAFRRAREQDEARPWPYLNEARLLTYSGRFEEAIEVLQTAIDVMEHGVEPDNVAHPAYVEAFYLIGVAFEALGNRDDAYINYFAALSADPLHQPSRLALNRLDEDSP